MWMEAITRINSMVTGPAATAIALAGAVGVVIRQRQRHRGERLQAARLQEELMAYMLLDDWRVGDARAMGRRICRTISRHSAFGTAALLVQDARGRLHVTASMRTDELTVCALERWAEAESGRSPEEPSAARRAHLVRLERRSGYKPGNPAALAWCTALIVPMCTDRGTVTGAIAVCADRFGGRPSAALELAMRPLEVLATRFASNLHELHQDGRQSQRQGGVVELAIGRFEAWQPSGDHPAKQGMGVVHDPEWMEHNAAGSISSSSMPGSLLAEHRRETRAGVSAAGHA